MTIVMFTGIVECMGSVTSVRAVAGGMRLRVKPGFPAGEVAPGASIAVNGVCLTAAGVTGDGIAFDVIRETLEKSNLAALRPPASVNLERSLRVGDRLDGHWVQGHVDATTTVTRKAAAADQWVLSFALADPLRPYIIPKGSVAIDGVSLTVAQRTDREFSVALIPTTLERTTLGQRNVGDRVNIETDLVVRTIVHNLACLTTDQGLLEKLRQAGYPVDR